MAISAGEARGDSMPLSGHLANVVLGRACPHCGYVLHKKGSWFQHVSLYRCVGCRKQVQMTYAAKVELFDQHPPPV
jgi:DNA-directed RNA polymerase subunit RPC12/RpoP